MKKTLLQSYVNGTTSKHRNQHPREEGLIATLSDIVDREGSFENLPKALPKIHEFHRMLIDRSKVKDKEELEVVATMMTACFSMMILDKQIARNKPQVDIGEVLKERIYEKINQLFYNGNDAGGIVINKVGNCFSITFTEEHDEVFTYTVEAVPKAVASFFKELEELSEKLKKNYQRIELKLNEEDTMENE